MLSRSAERRDTVTDPARTARNHPVRWPDSHLSLDSHRSTLTRQFIPLSLAFATKKSLSIEDVVLFHTFFFNLGAL
jgi:hypothetical protein